jgi:hypothetical protein
LRQLTLVGSDEASKISDMRVWHAPCKAGNVGAERSVSRFQQQEPPMFRIEFAQRAIVSAVAALLVASLAVSAAVPVLPIA